MSAASTLSRLVGSVAGGAAHAVTHPAETLQTAGSLAKGAVSLVTSVVTGPPEPTSKAAPATPTTTSTSSIPSTPSTQAAEPAPEPIVPATDGPPPEPTPAPVTTEPIPSDGDDWREELDEDLADELGVEAEREEGEREEAAAEPADDVPLLDPSVAKSVRKETARSRRAADPHKEDEA